MNTLNSMINSKGSVQTLEDLKQEPWILNLFSKLNEIQFQVDLSLFDEIKRMARASSILKPKITVVHEPDDMIFLQENIIECLSMRSRLLEISFSFIDVETELETMWELAEARLISYPVMHEKLSSDAKRNVFIKDLLAPIFEKRKLVNKLVDTCDRVKKHLDDVHFAQKVVSDLAITYIKSRGP